MSMQAVIDKARGELGYTEEPVNLTKYGFWYGVDGVPWCVIFLCWLFNQAGERMAFFGGGKTARCSVLMRWYKENGLTVPVNEAQPGDIVLLNFSDGISPDHCGLVVGRERNAVKTIEGNTTPGEEGTPQEQANGGCVALKTRFPYQIVGVCRPQYKEEEKPVDDITGRWSEADVRWCIENGLMEGYPDGSWKPRQDVTREELAAVLHRFDRKIMEDGGK